MRITKKNHPELFCAVPECHNRLTDAQLERCRVMIDHAVPNECAQYCSRAHKELAAQRRRRAARSEAVTA